MFVVFIYKFIMKTQQEENILKDIIIIVLLIGMIIIRFFPMGENNMIIQSMGYIGMMISLIDLHLDANRIYACEDKFHIIRGWTYLILFILSIFLLLILTGIISINSTWSDVFTLLALLISLPERLYLNWIGRYIKKRKGK